MECNKDEAVRAKGIAEKKLLEKDIVGAEKFALKAQSLFPELDGLSQFLEIINVHVAHEKKINGVADYYGILGVDPVANEETLKKQYKRMARSLHPDKNNSVGADGAFQIMSEAWGVLNNKDNRRVHDLKVYIRSSSQTASFRTSIATGTATSQSCSSALYHQRNTASGSQHIRTPQYTPGSATTTSSSYTPATCYSRNSRSGTNTKLTAAAGLLHNPALNMNVPNFQQSLAYAVPPHPRNSARPSGNPPLPTFASQNAPTPRPHFYNQNVPSRHQMASNTCFSRPETFWTLCNKCAIRYEYQNKFLNQNLICRRCMQPFLATAMPAPPVNSRCSQPRPFPNRQQQETPVVSLPPTSRTSQDPLRHPSKKHVKRRHEVTINNGSENNPPMKNSCSVSENVETASASYTAPTGLNREKPIKRRRKDGHKSNGSKEGSQGTSGSGFNTNKASSTSKGNNDAEQSRSVKELSQIDIRVMLMGKAKAVILHQLNEWEKNKLSALHFNRQDTSNIVHAFGNNSRNHSQTNDRQILQPLKETVVGGNPDDFVSMCVPDANFHNFDEDRIEKSFTQNQVWAAYDDDDGMPRYYAMVHRIISKSPFKMEISWLNSKSSSEFGSLDWIASGFTKTTGNFRVGKFVVNERLNSFSHPVNWKKGSRGVIQILPTKGDVWALYRNWSANWDETTADETIHKYDLVVVLQDYNEDKGVLVAPLVKVAGFTSVFNQLSDQRGSQTIPREEMFRFSHQVPFYVLNGLEAENAPKNCYELDPAALPLELLNVITDAESTEKIVSDPEMRQGNEAMTETCSAKPNANQRSVVQDPKYVFTYSRRNKEKKIVGDICQSKQ